MWTFRRDGKQLMLHCRESARGVTLIVSGDGDLRSYCFQDFGALLKFETEMSGFLLQKGWSPTPDTGEPRLACGRTDPASKLQHH